ncbi:unnamed protein product [Closterium sp. NIES-54]
MLMGLRISSFMATFTALPSFNVMPVRRGPSGTSTTSVWVDSSVSDCFPPSSLALLPLASYYTTVGIPADFSPAVGSSTDCPVADCSLVSLAAALPIPPSPASPKSAAPPQPSPPLLASTLLSHRLAWRYVGHW